MRVGVENQRIHRATQTNRQPTPLLVPLAQTEPTDHAAAVRLRQDRSDSNTNANVQMRDPEQQQLRRRMARNELSHEAAAPGEDHGAHGLWAAAAAAPNRRRVFAHIAGQQSPHLVAATIGSHSTATETTATQAAAVTPSSPTTVAAASAAAADNSDLESSGYDIYNDIDPYLDTQLMMLPPTPPRRRPTESESETDQLLDSASASASYEHHRQHLALSAHSEDAADAEAEARRALQRYSQMTRQRFLSRQRGALRGADPASASPPATPVVSAAGPAATQTQAATSSWIRFRMGEDLVMPSSSTHSDSQQQQQQHFPSNDVDSYWYNQPGAQNDNDNDNDNDDEDGDDDDGPWGHHRQPQIQPFVPASDVQRSAVTAFEETRRRAMLEVLRTHRTFGSGHSSDDSDSEMRGLSAPTIGTEDLRRQLQFLRNHMAPRSTQQQHQQHQQHRQPSWLADVDASARGSEKPEAAAGGAEAETDGAALARTESERRARGARTLIEERLERWLTRNTVRVRDLSCALLRPGMRFRGVQKIAPARRNAGNIINGVGRSMAVAEIEQWEVDVVVQAVDMQRGRVAGLMRAIDVPWMPRAVTTSWEGEIIDFVNHSPMTGKWLASPSDDQKYWALFSAVRSHPETFLQRWPPRLWGRRMPRVLEEYVFMRWKETAFVNVEQSETGLSIDGFYYICMQRTTGRIDGVYFDLSTQPRQRLSLQAENGGRCLAFAATGCC
ncbi:hypothetical protein LPJ72_000028 [Coemansia sp. Benny D160-2]|nr:hypothetical protein LPJ72_000028 [Coemansia sp. Benny D160-2]